MIERLARQQRSDVRCFQRLASYLKTAAAACADRLTIRKFPGERVDLADTYDSASREKLQTESSTNST